MPMGCSVRSDTCTPTRDKRPIGPLQGGYLVLSLMTALAGSLGWSVNRRQVDLQVYLMGARHPRDAHLYSLFLSRVHLPFTYPPFSTLVFWPLGLLPTGLAGALWALVNLTALALIIAVTLLVVRPQNRRGGPGVPWAVVGMLLGPAVLLEPVMLDLSFGQINLVLAAMVLVDATTRVSIAGRTVPRGVGIGVAAAIKLVPLIFIPFLILTRQFRAAAVAIVTAGACTVAAFILNPAASAAFWTRYVNDQTRIGLVTYVSNQSLKGALDRVTHHLWSAPAIQSVELLTAAAGLALATWSWRHSSRLLAVLVVADAGLLASPITWAHHMVWIVPVLLWLWWGADRPAYGRIWACVAAAVFFMAPMWRIANGRPFDTREHGWNLLAGNSFTVAALAFLVGVTGMSIARRRGPWPGESPAHG